MLRPRTRHTHDGFYDDIETGVQLDDLFPEPAAAIRLARKSDLSNILPAAFYHSSRLSISDDRDYMRQSNYIPDYAQPSARWRLLAGPAFLSLIRGQGRLRSFAEKSLDCPNLLDTCHEQSCPASAFLAETTEKLAWHLMGFLLKWISHRLTGRSFNV